jgi:hypothetical protein
MDFAVKSLVSSVIIIGGGYFIMKATTPSREQLQRKLEQEGHLQNIDQVRERNQRIVEKILENAKSDRPIWDVRFD